QVACAMRQESVVRCQELGVRGQQSGVRSQESGGRGQESGVRSQESGVRSQGSGVRSQESGVRSQESGVRSQGSGVRSQESGVRSQETGVRSQGMREAGSTAMAVISAKELEVYRKAYALAMRIYELSKRFPPEERYALTGQIRRSSRSVCTNLREAWAKRRYVAHFASKLTDSDGENAETDTSLDFARDCGFIVLREHGELTCMSAEVGKMLGSLIMNPNPFLLTPDS